MTRKFEAIISILDRASAPLLAIEDKMRNLGGAAKKTEVEIKEIGATSLLHARLGQDIHAIGAKIADVGRGIGHHLDGPLRGSLAIVGKLAEALPVLGSLGGLGSIAGIAEMIDRVDLSVGALENQSKITGIATAKLQQLDYAAKALNVPVSALTTGLERMTMRLGQAAQGRDKNLVALLHNLHIPLHNAHGGIASLSTILPKLNVAFAAIKNPTILAADAQLLLGRSSQKLLPLLSAQPAKLLELETRMKALGYTYHKADKEGLQKFHRSMNDLDFAVGGFIDNVASELAPALAPAVEMMARFVANNRALIAGDLKSGMLWLEHTIANFQWAKFEHRAVGAFKVISKDAGILFDILEKIDKLFPSDKKIEARVARADHLKDAPVSSDFRPNLPRVLMPPALAHLPGGNGGMTALDRMMGRLPASDGGGDLPPRGLAIHRHQPFTAPRPAPASAPHAAQSIKLEITHKHSFHGMPAGVRIQTTSQTSVPRGNLGHNGTIMDRNQ